MPQTPEPVYEFGPFRYDSAQRLLFRGTELLPLAPKAVDTLHALIQRRGRVVGKDELMKLVWPGTTVEEVGLARNISLLRKALGEDGAENLYIETIPRRGYRFIGAVRGDDLKDVPKDFAGVRRTPRPSQPDASESEPRPARRWTRPLLIVLAVVLALAGVIYSQFYIPSKYLTLNPSFPAWRSCPWNPWAPSRIVRLCLRASANCWSRIWRSSARSASSRRVRSGGTNGSRFPPR